MWDDSNGDVLMDYELNSEVRNNTQKISKNVDLINLDIDGIFKPNINSLPEGKTWNDIHNDVIVAMNKSSDWLEQNNNCSFVYVNGICVSQSKEVNSLQPTYNNNRMVIQVIGGVASEKIKS